MSSYSGDSASSVDDSEDLDDVPLSMAPNGRYEHDEPPMTSRGPPLAFSRPGAGFHLKLPLARPDDLPSPGPEGLQIMRSEPAYVGEQGRLRTQAGLSLSMGANRTASASYNGAAEEGVPLLGRRGPLKPPMLSLINPASASPVPSGAPTPAVTEPGEAPPRANAWGPSERARRTPLHVNLVSSAFALQPSLLQEDPTTAPGEATSSGNAAAASTRDRIALRCSSQLGIAPCDLEFFELRPLEDGNIPEGCPLVGVMIRGSTFSLSALEDLLARSQRDSQLTAMLDGALRDVSRHAAEVRQQAEQIAKQNQELAVLRERLRGTEAINQHLREQLQRSDEHRLLLGGTIRTIKKEFEDFKSRVVVEGSLEQLPGLQHLSLGAAAAGAAAGMTRTATAAGAAAAASSAATPVGSPPTTISGGVVPAPVPAPAPAPAPTAAPPAPRDGVGKQ